MLSLPALPPATIIRRNGISAFFAVFGSLLGALLARHAANIAASVAPVLRYGQK